MGESQLIDLDEAALTLDEKDRLIANERVIERGLESFYAVGMALADIRESRLYRQTHRTFEDYCRDRWGFSSSQARHTITAASVLPNIDGFRHLPGNTMQAELLSRVPADQQREAWQRVVETAPNGKVTGAHVAQVVNEIRNPTPMAVHYSSATPEWYTPAHIIDRVLEFFDEIDLDPCSNSGPAPNVPARDHITEAGNGLVQPWWGRVYVNPPYGDGIGQWTAKARDEYEAWRARNEDGNADPDDAPGVESIIMLLPARTDTEWFGHLQNYAICFIRGRLKFVGAESSAPFPSMLVYLGTDIDRFTEVMRPLGRVWTARPM